MMPGNPRSAGDRPPHRILRRDAHPTVLRIANDTDAPRAQAGRPLALLALLSLLLWSLLILAALHVVARILP